LIVFRINSPDRIIRRQLLGQSADDTRILRNHHGLYGIAVSNRVGPFTLRA
jgi:hypothetical protein